MKQFHSTNVSRLIVNDQQNGNAAANNGSTFGGIRAKHWLTSMLSDADGETVAASLSHVPHRFECVENVLCFACFPHAMLNYNYHQHNSVLICYQSDRFFRLVLMMNRKAFVSRIRNTCFV